MAPASLATVLSSKLPRLTRHTITTAAALRTDLRQVRDTGVGYDREEHTEGICTVGALIDAAIRKELGVD